MRKSSWHAREGPRRQNILPPCFHSSWHCPWSFWEEPEEKPDIVMETQPHSLKEVGARWQWLLFDTHLRNFTKMRGCYVFAVNILTVQYRACPHRLGWHGSVSSWVPLSQGTGKCIRPPLNTLSFLVKVPFAYLERFTVYFLNFDSDIINFIYMTLYTFIFLFLRCVANIRRKKHLAWAS